MLRAVGAGSACLPDVAVAGDTMRALSRSASGMSGKNTSRASRNSDEITCIVRAMLCLAAATGASAHVSDSRHAGDHVRSAPCSLEMALRPVCDCRLQ